ncbi:MAG: MerR family transcriptional regulator, partial [Candidatus Nanopelagicales bacterium]
MPGSDLPVEPLAEPLGLTVAAVARRLGVAPATLRTWDRRYGVGPTEHAAGSHRR